MPTILMLLQQLLPRLWSEADREEAYLAQSADHYDFERRLRVVDERGRRIAAPEPT